MTTVALASRPGRRRPATLALIVVLVAACGAPAGNDPGKIAAIDGANLLTRGARDLKPEASADDIAGVASADAEFALDLFREVATDSDQNVILGPHSIWTALAMIWAGARGDTAAEFADVLHLDRPRGDATPLLNALDLALLSRNDRGAVDLRIANQVFAQPGLPLIEDYLKTLTRDFGAPLAELAFDDEEAARLVINKWVADRTNDRIKELFPEGTIDPATVIVLCNAISMDAAWKLSFDPSLTSLSPFNLADGTVIDVPTMHYNLRLPLMTTDDGSLQAVELEYGKADLSMVVILPNDLGAFVRDLSPTTLQPIFDAITEQGIHLHLPKFSFSLDVPLDETLQRMGIKSAYGAGADFSGMTGSPGIALGTVQHEAFIEVDEVGTEAHAATGGGGVVSHGPTIIFDKPFIFVIRDRATGAILFIGQVTNPMLG